MDDYSLIRQCLAGDKASFEPLVERYKGLVWSIALHTLYQKEEAADAAQEVFLKVWKHLERYDPQYAFKTWISKITLNHCINLNQKKKAVVAWDEEEMERVPDTQELPENHFLNLERSQTLRQAVDALPEMYRIPIVLYHEQEMSYEEMCKVLQCPMTIVKNRLFRARKLLAGQLAEYAKKTENGGTMAWIATKHGNG